MQQGHHALGPLPQGVAGGSGLKEGGAVLLVGVGGDGMDCVCVCVCLFVLAVETILFFLGGGGFNPLIANDPNQH